MMNIKESRLSHNLSTSEAARLAGMEPIKWNQIERGNCVATEKDRLAIAGVLGDVMFFTDLEVLEKKAGNDLLISVLKEAKARITLTAGGAKPTSGICKCPACTNGSLRFSVASNGHVAAKCSTEDCLCWIE